MKEKLKVPKLRFKEFDDEWEGKNLGKISKFSKGKNISKADIKITGIECIRYGELYTHYNEKIETIYSKTNIDEKNLVLSNYNDVLIPASGETSIDIATASCVLKDKVALGGDINIIKTAENGVFLAYYLNNKKKLEIANLAQGNSVVHLYSTQLETLNLNIPSLPEQQKIADFLSKVDEKIEKLTKKKELLEQYKKGIMQKIFSQEIRFKDDNGKEFPEWEEKEVEEIFNTISTKEYQIKASEIVENGLFPVIDQGQKLVAGYCNDKQKLFFEELPVIIYGDHTTIIKYINYDFVIGADGTKILKNKIDGNLKFLYYSLCYNNIEPEGYKRHFSIIRKVLLNLPSLPEQQKIAYFLSSLDKKIDIALQELGQVQEFKKGLLQQMFV